MAGHGNAKLIQSFDERRVLRIGRVAQYIGAHTQSCQFRLQLAVMPPLPMMAEVRQFHQFRHIFRRFFLVSEKLEEPERRERIQRPFAAQLCEMAHAVAGPNPKKRENPALSPAIEGQLVERQAYGNPGIHGETLSPFRSGAP